MLLLTAVTFGGQDCVSALDFLPETEAEILKHRAQEMLQIPREKRIPLLVQEIKRLVTSRRGALWAADPEKLAEVLRHERPAVVELLLRAFPEALAETVRQQLPGIRATDRKVRPEVVNILRWKLEEVLEKAGARRAHFKFSDVLLLQQRELLSVCDHIGARALAPAVAGLSDADREAFLGGLAPDQRQLVAKYVAATGSRRLEETDAKELLEVHNVRKGPSEALRSAGAQRLARACLAQSAEFAARLLERYRGEFGQLLGKWVREERSKAVNRGDGGRTDIVAELEKLEQRGIIAKPVRLLPPPKRVGAGGPPGRPVLPTPGGKVNATATRAPGALVPPANSASRRDWVAEREARKAGAGNAPPLRTGELPRRDPVAERAARRAGAMSRSFDRNSRPDESQPEITAPVPPRKPSEHRPSPSQVRQSPVKRDDQGTSLARPPRSRGEMAEVVGPKPRGPKDGSG